MGGEGRGGEGRGGEGRGGLLIFLPLKFPPHPPTGVLKKNI